MTLIRKKNQEHSKNYNLLNYVNLHFFFELIYSINL